MTARLFQFPRNSRTNYPSVSEVACNSNVETFPTFPTVSAKTKNYTNRIASHDGYEQTAYGEFLSAFVADEGLFQFDTAGTSQHLSGNRNTLLQGG